MYLIDISISVDSVVCSEWKQLNTYLIINTTELPNAEVFRICEAHFKFLEVRSLSNSQVTSILTSLSPKSVSDANLAFVPLETVCLIVGKLSSKKFTAIYPNTNRIQQICFKMVI